MKETRAVPFARPLITDEDRQVVLDVLEGHVLTHGPQCHAFEEEFAHFIGAEAADCVSMSSCMGALHSAYLYLGVGPGDEVIVPAQTHTATVHAVEITGARPVFVDCNGTGNLTADGIAAAVTSRTKAISVVHFLGIPCEMARIMAVAEAHRLAVVEDCAIALGTRNQGRHVGLFGDVGCFSFYPAKHITTGEGGMLVSRHREVADRIRKLRAFGVDRSYGDREIPGYYEVVECGLNYRMSEIQAALGRGQLKRMQENLDRRRRNFECLRECLGSFAGIRVIDSRDSKESSSHYCLSIVLEDPRLGERRDEIVGRLKASGIGTSIYYPQPVPRMSYYRNKYGYDPSRYLRAAEISDTSIALPVGPHVTLEDIHYIAGELRSLLETFRDDK